MDKIIRIGAAALGFFVVFCIVSSVTQAKMLKLKESNSQTTDVVTVKTREKQLDCLAINIYREAGGESFEGKVAVAQVTINRTESGKFPKDICSVVYQKNVIMEKVVCQFSWACGPDHLRAPVKNDAYRESYEVAKKVLLEGFRLDMLKQALYYHADYVNPRWPFEKIGKVGQHVFYKAPFLGETNGS